MTTLIVWPCIIAWYLFGLRVVLLPRFRRAMIKGIAAEKRRWPTLYDPANNNKRDARKEWLSMDGGLLLAGCFLGAPVWPVVLLVCWLAKPFLAPTPEDVKDNIRQMEKDLGL